jgi:ABC-2 type transport system permease protein
MLRKIRVLFSTWIGSMLAYRAEIFIWILTGSIPLIMLAVWIGKAEAEGGSVGGFSASDFTAYFLAAWLSQQMIVAWVAWELDYQIRQGILSPKLLRPLDVYWEFIFMHLGERVIRLPVILVVVSLGLWLVPGTVLTPSIGHVLVFLVSIFTAWLIRFQIAYSIGTLSFWFDRSAAFDELYFVVAAFLTGSFAPIEFYPPMARAIIEWTPFPYLIYYPVQILTGAASGSEMLRILGIQLAWLSLFTLIRVLLWRRGLRRYGAVGA